MVARVQGRQAAAVLLSGYHHPGAAAPQDVDGRCRLLRCEAVGDALHEIGDRGPTDRAVGQRASLERPKDGAKLSQIYVTGYKDHFVKLRTTYLDKDKAECEKQIAKLLEALAAELK